MVGSSVSFTLVGWFVLSKKGKGRSFGIGLVVGANESTDGDAVGDDDVGAHDGSADGRSDGDAVGDDDVGAHDGSADG